MSQWRFIDSGTSSAPWNMAVDEALLSAFKNGDRPIFRLYRWEKPSLSFGRFSQPTEAVDMHRIRTENIPYARRITGGGILVHGNDISYSMVIPRSFVRERGVRQSYRELCRFLIALYKNLGADAAFAHDLKLPESQSPVCLTGTEAYDIMIGGRKIGGNAQRHTRDAMLQHGTIPLEIDREYFETLFLKNAGLSQATTLKEIDSSLTEAMLTKKITKAFTDTFGTMVTEESLNDEEQKLAQKLFDEKYSREAWNVHAEQ